MQRTLLPALLVLCGCARLADYGDPRLRPAAGPESAAASASTSAAAAEAGVVRSKGTVRRVEEEGGFWGVRADDGRRYRLTDLPPVYQKEGTRIRFTGRVREGAGGAPWSAVLDLTEVSGV